jgi:hypothetical protein
MLDYGFAQDIANEVYRNLNIPEDMHLQLDQNSAREFTKQYSHDYIGSLVDAEMANYDWSDNVPSDVEDIRENAIEEVEFKLEEIVDAYYHNYNDTTLAAYSEIRSVLENASFTNITGVDFDYDPADPDVGIYGDVRTITFTLTNGAIISCDVTFDD